MSEREILEYLAYFLSWFVPFGLNYIVRDNERSWRVWGYRILSTVVFAYLGNVFWPQFRNLKVNLIFIEFQPFRDKVYPFIGLLSYFGTVITKQVDKIKNHGWKVWALKLINLAKAKLEDK